MNATQQNNELLIGLGGTGKSIIERIFNEYLEYDYLICNSDNITIKQSRYFHTEQPEFIDINLGKSPCNKGEFRLSDEQINTLSPLLLAHKKTTLIVGLGGLTGTVLSKEIAFLAQKLNTNINIIAFLPFQFENKRSAIAIEAQETLQMMNVKLKMIEHAIESKKMSSDINMEDYLDYADNMACSMICNQSQYPDNKKTKNKEQII